jgi:cbb3-type cytochrome oxidase maturation protein
MILWYIFKCSFEHIITLIPSGLSVIFLLIGFSLLVAIIFLIAFLWNIKTGQYEDEYTPSVRILFEDEVVGEKKAEPEGNGKKEEPKT